VDNKRIVKKGIITALIVILSIGIIFVGIGFLTGRISGEGIFYDSYLEVFGLSKYITYYGWDAVDLDPISDSIKQDLCERLNIENSNNLCKSDSVVYAPDYFPVFDEKFRSTKDHVVTIDEINQIMQPYLYYCKQSQPKIKQWPESVIRCNYSLSREKVTMFDIYFDEESGEVFRMTSFNQNDFK